MIYSSDPVETEACSTEEVSEETIAQAERMVYIGNLERAIVTREHAERNWKAAAAEARRQALDIEDQLRQASEAAYFQGGRKGFSNDL